MEIFNIHLFEFVLIAALALVIFGPQRLPEVGRFLGKQVARFLAWQQQSPELKMINDIRSEFEQEIGNLRDELVRTRQQLDIQKEAQELQNEVKSALDPKALKSAENTTAPAVTPEPAPSIAPPRPDASTPPPAEIGVDAPPTPPEAPVASAADVPPPVDPAPALDSVAQAIPSEVRPNKLARTQPAGVLNHESDLPPVPRHRRNLHDSSHLDEPVAPPPPPSNEELSRQIAELSAELAALRTALSARGVLNGPPANQSSVATVAEETLSS